MSDEKLNRSIKLIEKYFIKDEKVQIEMDCGEKLFFDFAKENKNEFLKYNLSESTENMFEFTFLYNEFQKIYEKKLEELILNSEMSLDEFYEGLKRRCDEEDQEVILFVDILNGIIDYDSFIQMMFNLINRI